MALLALRTLVKDDVEEMNALPHERRRDYTYTLFIHEEKGAASPFEVKRTRDGTQASAESSKFELEDAGLRIHPHGAATFHVTVCFNAKDLTCHYQIDHHEVQLWEISRKALETMFFEL